MSTVEGKRRENESRWQKVRKMVLLSRTESRERPRSHSKKGRNKMHDISALCN